MRWSEQQMGQRPPPTAVMVHGILGSRKNMHAYARRLVEVRLLSGANILAVSSTQCFAQMHFRSFCARVCSWISAACRKCVARE